MVSRMTASWSKTPSWCREWQLGRNLFHAVENDGFWVNQEDVSAASNALGSLEELFDCSLYADAARQDKVKVGG